MGLKRWVENLVVILYYIALPRIAVLWRLGLDMGSDRNRGQVVFGLEGNEKGDEKMTIKIGCVDTKQV